MSHRRVDGRGQYGKEYGIASYGDEPMRHAYASRGGSLRQHSIILCTSAYKFLSNLHQLNEIASSTAPGRS